MGHQRRQLRTIRGYDFFEVASSLQKAVRRCDVKTAGYFGLELFHSGFDKYLWKRLFTISAEDCHGIITGEIKSLHDAYQVVNEGVAKSKPKKGRIFISKAIILMCYAPKSRDADHLQNLVYDHKMSMSDQEIDEMLESVREEATLMVPDYAFDCHTRKGKKAGATKSKFFDEELEALKPRQMGLFDNLVDEAVQEKILDKKK
jgi:replication-associated recombination protein RarA